MSNRQVFSRCAIAFIVLVSISAVVQADGVWLDVPFVKQESNGCGAACISMVMQYWSRNHFAVPASNYDPRKIMDLLYSKQANGILASDMQKYFQQQGFQTFAFSGSSSDLENHLTKGRPLIVCLAPNNDGSLHYVVVTGMRPQQSLVLMNDPAGKKLESMESARFEKEWKVMKNWTLLAVPATSKQ